MRKRDHPVTGARRTKHPEALLAAMVITILIIAGFQAYWLRDNYRREKNVTEVKAFSLFRETIRNVQDSIIEIRLQSLLKDTSSQGAIKKGLAAGTIHRRVPGVPGAARVLNILTDRRENKTSLRDRETEQKNIVISLHERDSSSGNERYRLRQSRDSGVPGPATGKKFLDVEELTEESPGRVLYHRRTEEPLDSTTASLTRINTLFIDGEESGRVSISIDSLFRDTIPINDLDSIFSNVLLHQHLPLPYSIRYEQSGILPPEQLVVRPMEENSFAGYTLVLGNMFPYLLKKISLPILFSMFLVALTVASFVLLYRNILRQQKLAQLKNDLVSNITHELKTPIATVHVAIEALKNFNALQDTAKTHEYLDISQRELQRLELLVDKVLKLSMFENQEIKLSIEQIDLDGLVREVIAAMRLQVEKQNGQIHFQSPGLVIIRGDRLHLLSVVFNLLDNA
ncbi:MAG: hypothetical protein EOO02_19020, partial [Chitinophagaceae bacterium]